MIRLLKTIRNGKDLRLAPMVYSSARQYVRVRINGLSETPIDVTNDHVPVSLRPLILGIRLGQPASVSELDLEIFDELEKEEPLARIRLKSKGNLPLREGALHLFETAGCHNRCIPLSTRWLRYALVWRHARKSARRKDALKMSAGDLISLNAYYIAPRPVYLVSVAHEGRNNLFPMDLVGRVSSGEFLLALRATSPAIELMEKSRRLALSSAPASQTKAVYALGEHHRRQTIDIQALPFVLRPSPLFGLPVLADAETVREIEIHEVYRVGSHVLFLGRIAHESGHADGQLAHVSGMYAEWLARRHRPLQLVTPL